MNGFWLVGLLFSGLISSQAFAGGITAGGGDISSLNPTRADKLREMVVVSKAILQTFANEQEYSWETVYRSSGQRSAMHEFLFQRPDSFFDYLAKAEIHLRWDGACPTADGRETDGSVHGEPAHMICISAQRLTQKLSDLNYEYEVPALILHEIVHQMGGDETLAVEIQNFAVLSLNKQNRFSIWFPAIKGNTLIDMAVPKLNEMTQQLPSYADVSAATALVNKTARELASNLAAHTLRAKTRANFDDLSWKLRIAADYVGSVDPKFDKKTRKSFRDRYAKAFAGRSEILVTEYDPEAARDSIRTLKARKITDRAGLNRELLETVSLLEAGKKDLMSTLGLAFVLHEKH